MCGFAAIYRHDGPPVDLDDLRRMSSLLQHRGPDEAGYALLEGGRLGLGHLRLSIIDLAHGQQPMFSADGALAIVFNGEIYDYQKHQRELRDQGYPFQTASDTEVILALYQRDGVECLQYLEGEFAFILWDARRRHLFAARDRSGVKPLFYARDTRTGELIFASEAKAILALERVEHAISPAYLLGPWVGAYPLAACAFEGIAALPPAHRMVVDGSAVDVRPYWQHTYQPQNITLDEACRELRRLFGQAVRRRLVADVKVGSYLSGGIDSTLVCAAMVEHGARPCTFNIGFGGSAYDESSQARQVADHFDLPFETFDCTLERTAEALPDALFHIEFAIANPCAVGKFLLSRCVRDAGYKVCLTGEGADENFAGFPYFKLETLWRMQLAGGAQARTARALWKRFQRMEARTEGIVWTRRKPSVNANHPFGYPSFHHQRALDYARLLPSIINFERLGLTRGQGPAQVYEETYDAAYMRSLHPVNAAREITWRQLYNYVIPVLGDRTEMAHSVECRTPYLDRDLLEFCDRLPPEFLVDIETLREKFILYESYKGVLPKHVASGHKHTYLSPDWRSLRQVPRGRELIDEYLSRSALHETGLFNPTEIRRFYWLWRTLPADAPLRKRLDLMIGSVLSIQIMADRLIRRRPRGDIRFSMQERRPRLGPELRGRAPVTHRVWRDS